MLYTLAAQSRVQPSFDNSYLNLLGLMYLGTTAGLWSGQNIIIVKVVYAGSSSKHHDPSDSPYAMY